MELLLPAAAAAAGFMMLRDLAVTVYPLYAKQAEGNWFWALLMTVELILGLVLFVAGMAAVLLI